MKRTKAKLISICKYSLYVILPLILALVIRSFFCNFYRISSNSMEPTILPGDYILADKWTFGARIFTSFKFDENSDPSIKQISGFRKIKRNDVVVFNFPFRHTWDTIRMDLEKTFVKRCIGLPGDSVSAIGGFYHVYGLTDTLGFVPEQKRLVRNRSTLDSVIIRTVAFEKSFKWDIFDFGPFYVPAVGDTIALTPNNFKLYHKQILYETRSIIRMEDSLIFLNDTLRHEYVFSSNWYFMSGDNVMNSQDSRYIGLIPEAYIIGRASLVLTSKDREIGKQRWNRILKRIR